VAAVLLQAAKATFGTDVGDFRWVYPRLYSGAKAGLESGVYGSLKNKKCLTLDQAVTLLEGFLRAHNSRSVPLLISAL
jgi:hypothetical protein